MVKPINIRIKQHQRSNKCPLLYNAFKKYSSFQVEILLIVNDDLLDKYEILFIDMFQTLSPFGYNLSTGSNNVMVGQGVGTAMR